MSSHLSQRTLNSLLSGSIISLRFEMQSDILAELKLMQAFFCCKWGADESIVKDKESTHTPAK